MALPTRTDTFNNIVTSTGRARRPGLIDSFFGSAAFFATLRAKKKIRTKGGEVIQVNHIYGGFDATSYSRGQEFSTAVTEFATAMIFNWKFHYSPCNLNLIDVELNNSPERVFDLAEAAMENAELSLINDLADQSFGDGTGNGSLDMDGLGIAVSRSGTYGGITRAATYPGAEIRAAVEDTTGGSTTLSTINTNFGTCTIGPRYPDLLVTTQTIHNTIWNRSQPSEQNAPSKMRDIGFRTVRFNGSDVVVDPHCTSGYLYLLNTEFFELHVHPSFDFRFRGFMEPTNQQLMIGQLITWMNLVCRGPRFQGVMTGLS